LKLLARLRKLSAFLWTSFLALAQKSERKEVCVVSDLEFVATFNSLSSDKQAIVIGEIEKLLASQSKSKRKENTQDE
jgi:hypothetical protein